MTDSEQGVFDCSTIIAITPSNEVQLVLLTLELIFFAKMPEMTGRICDARRVWRQDDAVPSRQR